MKLIGEWREIHMEPGDRAILSVEIEGHGELRWDLYSDDLEREPWDGLEELARQMVIESIGNAVIVIEEADPVDEEGGS